MIIRAKDISRIAPRPDITIIRNAADFYVKIWNVPQERTSSFFYCYYNYTPDAAEIIVNDKSYMLGPEHFIIIPPELPHKLKQIAPFRHFFCHFLAGSPYSNLREIISVPAAPYAHYLELIRDPAKRNLAFYALLYSLLLEIPPEKMKATAAKDRKIEKVLQIIQNNPSESLSLEMLARQTNMSVSSLSHRFKKATGITPAQYVLQFRLELALLYLADTDGPGIEAIAEQCGFANRYHFSKQFKKQYGMAPGQMKRYMSKDKTSL